MLLSEWQHCYQLVTERYKQRSECFRKLPSILQQFILWLYCCFHASTKPKTSEISSKINTTTEILINHSIISFQKCLWNTVTSDCDAEFILKNVCALCWLSKDVRCQLYCCTSLIWRRAKRHSEPRACAQPPWMQRCASANCKCQFTEHDTALWSQARLFPKATLIIYNYNDALITKHWKKSVHATGLVWHVTNKTCWINVRIKYVINYHVTFFISVTIRRSLQNTKYYWI